MLQVRERLLKPRDYRRQRLQEEDGDDSDAEVEINSGNIQENVETRILQSASEQIHTIILDMAPVSFIDATGAKTLQYVSNLVVK